MKLKQRILAAFAAAAMLCGVAGCSSTDTGTKTDFGSLTNNGTPISPGVLSGAGNLASQLAANLEKEDKVYKIGISKLMTHAALDLSEQGFVDALKASGLVEGVNLELTYRNGNGDESALNSIAQEFIANGDDLIFAIATPAAQTAAKQTSEIPIIATAVTDFIDAGLAESSSRPGKNVSGTTDMSPIEEQIDLLLEVLPDVETLGLVYTASESNSVLQIDIAKAYAEKRGLATVERAIETADDIADVFSAIADECDAVYLPTDNLLASEMAAVAAVCEPAGLPVICAESGMVQAGGLCTLAIDYYDLGYQAGIMAVKVLGGSNITRLAIQKSSKFEYSFNSRTVEVLGITLPDKYLSYLN